MSLDISKTVEIPDEVTVTFVDNVLKVTGENGSIERHFWYPGISIELSDSEILIDAVSKKKTQKAMIGTIASHMRNMIKGVTEGFEYKMKVVYSHFPMQIKVEKDKLVVNNFLGEKKPRSATIVGSTKVKTTGDELTINGPNIEEVGQTAANIEQLTRIKRFDPRVFQDGIYLTEKRV